MKKLLVFLLFSQLIYSQKTYDFDYMLEYKSVLDSTKLISKPFYLINSKANNYLVLSYRKDSLNNMFNFGEFEGKKRPYINEPVNRQKLLETNLINVDCVSILFQSEYPFKYKVKDYYFENLNDTIINSVSYYHYAIKCNRSLKYQKRKSIQDIHFIVDRNSPTFLPFFINQTVYEEWKLDKKIPNGIVKIKYYVDWENKITIKWVLEKITPIKKVVIIPEKCN
ncbi:hypothetical protein [Flavobacterium sp.]|uniref:hypothetical protein n=1 Tax=Flavobacterium sp. TaxID=239 RepID=UPI002A81A31D|nr:hypothetical protein [Flavobacterium sp.]